MDKNTTYHDWCDGQRGKSINQAAEKLFNLYKQAALDLKKAHYLCSECDQFIAHQDYDLIEDACYECTNTDCHDCKGTGIGYPVEQSCKSCNGSGVKR